MTDPNDRRYWQTSTGTTSAAAKHDEVVTLLSSLSRSEDFDLARDLIRQHAQDAVEGGDSSIVDSPAWYGQRALELLDRHTLESAFRLGALVMEWTAKDHTENLMVLGLTNLLSTEAASAAKTRAALERALGWVRRIESRAQGTDRGQAISEIASEKGVDSASVLRAIARAGLLPPK